jgi:hypothetical protein
MLKDSDSEVSKVSLAGALVKIGAPAVGPLLVALRDSTEEIRKISFDALKKIEDTRAVEPLLAMLKFDDKQVREAAAIALARLGWQPGKDETGARYWATIGVWDKCICSPCSGTTRGKHAKQQPMHWTSLAGSLVKTRTAQPTGPLEESGISASK